MKKSESDAGTIAALVLRLRDYRLPRAKRLLEKVNNGKLLSDHDIRFLKRVQADARDTQALVKRSPEYEQLIIKTLNLYTEIIDKGLENEKT